MIPIDVDADPPRELRPAWLGPADHGWLAALTDVYARHDGRPRHELDAALRLPLLVPAPPRAQRLAEGVLARLLRAAPTTAPSPMLVRELVFRAARDRPERGAAIAEVARTLELEPEAVEERLFADLPSERRITCPPAWPEPAVLVRRVNQAWARSALVQSVSVRLEVLGETRRIVRVARLRGLLVGVRDDHGDGGAVLELSGPYSLLRATTVYGRALAALLPHLVHTSRFVLRATSKLGVVTRLERGDPIFDAGPPPPCDSAIETAFAERFRQATRDWDLVREPEPIAAGAALVFPDFALIDRRTGKRVLLEIVGFWTPEYLAQKLGTLRRAKIENLVLCISERLRCGAGELPPDAIVVPFRRRIDPADVLTVLERL